MNNETIVMFRKNEEGMIVQFEGKGADIMTALTILIIEFGKHSGYNPKDVVDDLFKGVSSASEEILEALKGGNESE